MEQAISVAGSLLILAAYAGHQRGLIDRTHSAYNWMNFIGALVLTVIAFRAQQWGFVLLEGAWTVISVPPLIRPRPSRPPN
jgi:hypothetical protein